MIIKIKPELFYEYFPFDLPVYDDYENMDFIEDIDDNKFFLKIDEKIINTTGIVLFKVYYNHNIFWVDSKYFLEI